MSTDGDTVTSAWNQWFDNQWDLTRCVDRAVTEQSAGKGDGFRVALYAAVIEHCAEAMRAHIPDVALSGEGAGTVSLQDEPCAEYVDEPEIGDDQWCNRCGWPRGDHR